MSQMGVYGTTGSKQISGIALDEFATIAFTSPTGTFVPGEQVVATKAAMSTTTVTLAVSGTAMITRAAGDFVSDGVVIGSQIIMSGATVTADNHVYTVTAVTSTTQLVVSPAPTAVDTANASIALKLITSTAKVSGYVDSTTLRVRHIKGTGSMTAFADAEVFTGGKSAAVGTVGTGGFVLQKNSLRQSPGKVQAATSLTLGSTIFAASGTTITRATSTWTVDGVVVGSKITISGTASNNAVYTVTSVTSSTVIVVTPAPVNETITPTATAVNLALTAGVVTFTASGTTIQRGTGSFATDGIVVGSQLLATGTASNNTTFTVTAVTSGTVLVVTPAPVNETTNATTLPNPLQPVRLNLKNDLVTLDDRGTSQQHIYSGTRSINRQEIKQAIRLALSKSQATDTTVTPTTTWTMPAAATYSLAAGTLVRFIMNSTEILQVTGAPRLTINSKAATLLTTGNLIFSNTKTITRASGSWATDGVTAGMQITIASSVSNNAVFTAVSVDGTAKILTVVEAVTTEGSVAATATTVATTAFAYYNNAYAPTAADVLRGTQIAFDWVTAGPMNIGQIVSAVYGANGGTIKDVGVQGAEASDHGIGSTITPATMGSVTGIILGI